MKKFFKLLGFVLFAILLIAGAGLAYVFVALPKNSAAPDIKIEATPERLERGKYLVENVTNCVNCHSTRDEKIYSAPVVKGTEGAGGKFIENARMGTLVSPNITPHALKSWTDGEILRALISGVNRSGDPLFPIMPYPEFREMPREDLYAVIAYIRTLEPRATDPPRTKLKFPLNLIVRSMPGPVEIRESAPANRGEYLTLIAGCKNCHTPMDDRGQPLPGMDFAGGFELEHPSGQIIYSINITPDNETGIGKWSREQFIEVFKRYESPDLRKIPVESGNTVMPWTAFSGLTVEDLGAIYDYLRTVKPVHHEVKQKSQQM